MISKFQIFLDHALVSFTLPSFRTRPICSQIDDVYRYVHGSCDILEGKSVQANNPNPHQLFFQESNDLLTGLKKLLNESNNSDDVRILTIVPKEWGREKVRK